MENPSQNSLLGGENGQLYTEPRPRKPRKRTAIGRDGEEPPSPEDDNSDGSSRSTSEELELDDMASDDGPTDDEETGLTTSERHTRRKWKRRRNQLDARIGGDVKVTKLEEKLADQSVVKRLVINAILIGLWYLFSLSISIVSILCCSPLLSRTSSLIIYSTTNGCSPPNTSISTSPSSQPAYTCLSNSPSPAPFSTSSPDFDPNPPHPPPTPQ